MKDDTLYLVHIRDSIERIMEFTAAGKQAFLGDRQTQDAVIRNFEVMGEAAKRLSPEARSQAEAIPWRRIAGFRDVLIHRYDEVAIPEVWNIIERDLPELRTKISRLLEKKGLRGD